MTVRSAGLTALAVASFPARFLHEMAHALFAAPFAEELAIIVEPGGLDAAVGIEWHDSAPEYAILLSYWAPMLIGLAVGIWGAVRFVGGVAPREPVSLLKWGVIAFWWAWFSMPSSVDLTRGD